MNMREKWVALTTLWRKETIRYLRIWPQTILPAAITITLYFFIFGGVIGGVIGLTEGVSYMTFIMPGLIMMAMINASYANVVGSFFGARFNRSIEELFISPMPAWLIVLGFLGGGVGRGIVVGFFASLLGLIFSGVHVQHFLLTLFIFLLCSILFSLAGLINGIFARKFDDTSIVTTFILTPLIYLGGVFYPIASLPPLWRGISELNPLHYLITTFRYSMLGLNGGEVQWAISVLVVFALLLFGLACWLIARGVGIKT